MVFCDLVGPQTTEALLHDCAVKIGLHDGERLRRLNEVEIVIGSGLWTEFPSEDQVVRKIAELNPIDLDFLQVKGEPAQSQKPFPFASAPSTFPAHRVPRRMSPKKRR